MIESPAECFFLPTEPVGVLIATLAQQVIVRPAQYDGLQYPVTFASAADQHMDVWVVRVAVDDGDPVQFLPQVSSQVGHD